MFPKEAVAAIGVIQRTGAPDDDPRLPRRMEGAPRRRRCADVHSTGHLTRWRERDSPLRRGRVIVAGDAAGLLEPWLREGISFALRSGTWAGEAAAAAIRTPSVSRSTCAGFTRELVPEQRRASCCSRCSSACRWLLHWALGLRAAQKFFVRYGRDETTLASFWGPRWVMPLVGLVFRVRR